MLFLCQRIAGFSVIDILSKATAFLSAVNAGHNNTLIIRIRKQQGVAHFTAHSVKGIITHYLNILQTVLHLRMQLLMLILQSCQLILYSTQLLQRICQYDINIGFLALSKEVIFFCSLFNLPCRLKHIPNATNTISNRTMIIAAEYVLTKRLACSINKSPLIPKLI